MQKIPVCPQAAGIFYLRRSSFTTKSEHFTTRGGYNHNKEGKHFPFQSILVVTKTPKPMTYKIKSLVYLFAFILACLLYYNMDAEQDTQANNNPEVVAHSPNTANEATLIN